ncbi:outer membrane protein [Roseovarius pacificus]|uniref:Outer membrane protein n=1 Tax=Roseovarius pacificus TaxID=337701 RepID=A0A1M6XRZ4_9RHOB|nr:OmpW family outer membrane protein [Roseovarius pacificus]GGO51821.1 membrane protein [Roseovarius pacificus]SHL08668.1 outer membrane protein [Roseovarius pacificus]
MKKITAFTLATALATAAAPALAQEQGDMTLGFGLAAVMPADKTNTTLAGDLSVDDNVRPTLTFEYFVADNIGVEVLAAWPFEHTVSHPTLGNIVKTKHLPPTISVNYHFTNKSSVTPFVGVGVNYTTFWDDNAIGLLTGTPVSLDDSWGIALHAGLDFKLTERSSLRTDIRWIDIDTDVTVGGSDIGTVSIDPLIVGVSYVMKF